ncbi:MAG TPA: nuclear transport factor 2 family protein [Acidimicrobiales bacterium]|nr:nuclear transport factor 2 family protein [Acidimicrobiales bacterium]
MSGLTPDDLVAIEEIRGLALRYALAVDRRDLDAHVALFVDDVDAGPHGIGREALKASFDESLRAVGVTMLLVGNHLVELDPDDHDLARGTVYCLGRIQADPGSPRMIEQAIQYSDRYRCSDGEWRFVGRKHELFWGAELTEQPLAQPPADWPAHQFGVGTVPHRYETWQRFWGDGPPA